MGHGHHHHAEMSGKKLYWAVFINVLLTALQVIGGLLSGSLSLLADALHNFSDAGALAIAAIAAKISHMPANKKMTFGYQRAEILGALINSTVLIVVGFYLIYEAVNRYFDQKPIDGWTVVGVASVALVIDIMTAFLTYSGSKESVNVKAAFVHNVSDALASVVVIVSGLLIIHFQVYVVDLLATLLISVYVLFHGFALVKKCVLILMQATPEHLDVDEIKKSLGGLPRVKDAHHIHLWQLDDKKTLLEGHLCIDERNLPFLEAIKQDARELLKEKFSVEHTTLEIEISATCENR